MLIKHESKDHEYQRYLAWLGLYLGRIDGKFFSKSLTALSTFADLEELDNEYSKEDILQALKNKILNFYVEDWDDAESMAKAVYSICKQMYYPDIRYPAYMMATAQWETGQTLKPIEEGGLIRDINKRRAYQEGLSYFPYFGRGYVQLTHDYNYSKYGELLNLPLLSHPELAKEKEVAIFILVHGMLTGAFTGLSMSKYITEDSIDKINIRRVVNGVPRNHTLPDKSVKIAKYYDNWLKKFETLEV